MINKAILIFTITLSSYSAFSSAELDRGIALNENKQYKDAAGLLYRISKNSKYQKERGKISYELGKSYRALGYNQAAIFQFINAVKTSDSAFLSDSLRNIANISFALGDEYSLNYALSKIKISKFPKKDRPLLYFRFGQAYLSARRYSKAAKAFSKISSKNPLYSKARYFAGLAYSEAGKLEQSYRAFTQSANARAEEGVSDGDRVAALMGRARVLYHMKRWDESLEAYRIIPRDTKYFHDMLFESSWAMLRSGKFRSALSNFQSLHSKYYDEYFFPEATLLRAIVYLYICKTDEVQKVTKTYDQTYGKMYRQLKKYLKSGASLGSGYKELSVVLNAVKNGESVSEENFEIPYLLLRHISRSSEIQKVYSYLQNIQLESAKIKKDSDWVRTPEGGYAYKALVQRNKKAKERLARALRQQLKILNSELLAFEDQKELIEFELISSEKELARKTLEGRNDDLEKADVGVNRVDYIKNGYEYWPFKGEYWLDEIGNYHYLGASRCE